MVEARGRFEARSAFHRRPAAGQSSTEFLVLLGILTVIGYFIMRSFAPTGGDGGIQKMGENATDIIAADRQ